PVTRVVERAHAVCVCVCVCVRVCVRACMCVSDTKRSRPGCAPSESTACSRASTSHLLLTVRLLHCLVCTLIRRHLQHTDTMHVEPYFLSLLAITLRTRHGRHQ